MCSASGPPKSVMIGRVPASPESISVAYEPGYGLRAATDSLSTAGRPGRLLEGRVARLSHRSPYHGP